MKIAGIQKNSFVDYPGKIAAVVFTPGCNMNCFFCHNRELISPGICLLYDTAAFISFLNTRKDFLEGVVITGGEPTLQPGLAAFIQEIKALNLCVKLDTNGTRPEILNMLMKKHLVDYIAMDIKAPYERYEEICCSTVSLKMIQKSVEILMNGQVDYEFRTTFIPQLSEQDILKIASGIKDAKKYVLQQYRKPTYVNAGDTRLSETPHTSKAIALLQNKIEHLIGLCEIRGI